MLVQPLFDALVQTGIVQQQRREVDCHPAIRPPPPPACAGFQRLVEHSIGQPGDQAILLRYRDERRGSDRLAAGLDPAGQRLGSDNRAAGQRRFRLEPWPDLSVGDGLAQAFRRYQQAGIRVDDLSARLLPQQALQRGGQDRLAQHPCHAEPQAGGQALAGCQYASIETGGQYNDRGRVEFRQQRQGLKPVLIAEQQVEDDDVEARAVLKQGLRFGDAGSRGGNETHAAGRMRGDRAVQPLIVDDEQALRRRQARGRGVGGGTVRHGPTLTRQG